MSKEAKSTIQGAISAIFIMGMIASAIILGSNYQTIYDHFAAQNYKPSPEVDKILDKISLTDNAKRTFFATDPQVESSETFNQNCRNNSEQTTILGCYSADRIHIYDVKDAKLEGVKDVTAAHELLHAEWQRMSTSEKEKVSDELKAQYEKSKTQKFQDLMEKYRISEPGQEVNELHSIIGTEIENISPELEAHYAKYFKNRKGIVAINTSYKHEFEKVEAENTKIIDEMKQLKQTIESEGSDYDAKVKNLNNKINDFNARANSGAFYSQAQFLAERRQLVDESNNLEILRKSINDKVAQFNNKRKDLESNSAKGQQLYDAINSKASSETSIK